LHFILSDKPTTVMDNINQIGEAPIPKTHLLEDMISFEKVKREKKEMKNELGI